MQKIAGFIPSSPAAFQRAMTELMLTEYTNNSGVYLESGDEDYGGLHVAFFPHLNAVSFMRGPLFFLASVKFDEKREASRFTLTGRDAQDFLRHLRWDGIVVYARKHEAQVLSLYGLSRPLEIVREARRHPETISDIVGTGSEAYTPEVEELSRLTEIPEDASPFDAVLRELNDTRVGFYCGDLKNVYRLALLSHGNLRVYIQDEYVVFQYNPDEGLVLLLTTVRLDPEDQEISWLEQDQTKGQ